MEASMESRYPLMRHLAAGIVCCLAFVGCASFPGGDLPMVSYEQIISRDPKPSISYEATFVELGELGSIPGRIDESEVFQEEVNKVFTKSNMFSEIHGETKSEKYHITLILQGKGKNASSSLSPLYANYYPGVMTLMIVPSYSKDEYILNAVVKKGNQILKQYRYKQSVYNWYQFPLMLVLLPTHNPVKVQRKIIENLLLNLLRDLGRDRILVARPEDTQ